MASERERQWDRNVVAAAHTVWANDDVVAAYVVLPSRPSYRQLSHYRDYEKDLNIRLTVLARGGVFVQESEPVEALTPLSASSLPERDSPRGHHAPVWLRDFLLVTEGVR